MFFAKRLDQNYPFRTEDDINEVTTPMPTSPEAVMRKHPDQARGRVQSTWRAHKAALRLHGATLNLRPLLPRLPKAPIVTGLHLPPYTYRSIEITSLKRIFRQSLVALRWLRFSRNRAMKIWDEERLMNGK